MSGGLKDDKLMKIGELAKKSGLSIRAIRYYEEIGILQPAARSEGNYRLYDQNALRLLNTVKRMKLLGLSLDVILNLKEIYTREGSCGPVRQRFLELIEEQIRRIDFQIRELTILKEDIKEYRNLTAEYLRQVEEGALKDTCREQEYVSQGGLGCEEIETKQGGGKDA